MTEPRLVYIANIIYILPYFAISITCSVALCKIRSFLKSKGLANRINTCNIVIHLGIFVFFSIELVIEFLFALLQFKHYANFTAIIFDISLDIGDLTIVWILYKLGTK